MPYNKDNNPLKDDGTIVLQGATSASVEQLPEAYEDRGKTVESAGMLHLNGDILCAVCLLTTGKRLGEGDLIQICILPLDAFLLPMKGMMPYYTDIAPSKTYEYFNLSPRHQVRAREAAKLGIDSYSAALLLHRWFDTLGIRDGKKMVPLVHDWPTTYWYLLEWLGPETMYQLFNTIQLRDLQATGCFINDVRDFHGERAPFGRVALSSLSRHVQYDNDYKYDMLQRAQTIAEVYRRMVKGL